MKYGDGMMPPARPEITREQAIEWATEAGCTASVFILGRRGYYRDSMGVKGKQERSLYDDAFAIVTPDLFAVFNGNTDPVGAGGRLATLQPGVHLFQLGNHHKDDPAKSYPALVQAEPFTVHRDDGTTETGWFGINMHCGFFGECGSAGCQTVPPTQYSKIPTQLPPKLRTIVIATQQEIGEHGPFFIDTVHRIMIEEALKTIPYVLTERADA